MLNADALSQLRQLKSDIEEHKVVYSGTVKATNGRFGFVALDDGRDVFLPPEEMQRVLPGDRVNITEQEGDKGKTRVVYPNGLSLPNKAGSRVVAGSTIIVPVEPPPEGKTTLETIRDFTGIAASLAMVWLVIDNTSK